MKIKGIFIYYLFIIKNMVLAPELTKDEIKRHCDLIMDFIKFASHSEGEYIKVLNNEEENRVCSVRYASDSKTVDIEFLDNGQEKGVYKVRYGNQELVAAAAARDHRVDLSEEYYILNQLYNGVPELFPRPELCYNPKQREMLGQLLIMELLPHIRLDKFRRQDQTIDRDKNLAYIIGRNIAIVHEKTGRISTDPHDGNILAQRTNQGIEIAFCDAIQFKEGSLEEGIRCILANKGERPECFRFIHKFRDGIADGICAVSETPLTRVQVYPQLEYLREYNDIF